MSASRTGPPGRHRGDQDSRWRTCGVNAGLWSIALWIGQGLPALAWGLREREPLLMARYLWFTPAWIAAVLAFAVVLWWRTARARYASWGSWIATAAWVGAAYHVVGAGTEAVTSGTAGTNIVDFVTAHLALGLFIFGHVSLALLLSLLGARRASAMVADPPAGPPAPGSLTDPTYEDDVASAAPHPSGQG